MMQDSDGAIYDLSILNQSQRRGKARLLLTSHSTGVAPKIVYRHLRDGDVVIMNRQPTLHRASMMCHFIRVLKVCVDWGLLSKGRTMFHVCSQELYVYIYEVLSCMCLD